MLRASLRAAVLACLCATAACYSPRELDLFTGDIVGFPDASAGRIAALYLPNRLVDLLDLVHFGVGVGPCIGVDLQATRYLRLEAARGASLGLGWFGRRGQWYQAAVYTGHTFTREWETNDRMLEAFHIPLWDLGIQVHLLAGHAYLGIAPLDEGLDLLAGLLTFDLKGDDW